MSCLFDAFSLSSTLWLKYSTRTFRLQIWELQMELGGLATLALVLDNFPTHYFLLDPFDTYGLAFHVFEFLTAVIILDVLASSSGKNHESSRWPHIALHQQEFGDFWILIGRAGWEILVITEFKWSINLSAHKTHHQFSYLFNFCRTNILVFSYTQCLICLFAVCHSETHCSLSWHSQLHFNSFETLQRSAICHFFVALMYAFFCDHN